MRIIFDVDHHHLRAHRTSTRDTNLLNIAAYCESTLPLEQIHSIRFEEQLHKPIIIPSPHRTHYRMQFAAWYTEWTSKLWTNLRERERNASKMGNKCCSKRQDQDLALTYPTGYKKNDANFNANMTGQKHNNGSLDSRYTTEPNRCQVKSKGGVDIIRARTTPCKCFPPAFRLASIDWTNIWNVFVFFVFRCCRASWSFKATRGRCSLQLYSPRRYGCEFHEGRSHGSARRYRIRLVACHSFDDATRGSDSMEFRCRRTKC